MTLDEVWRQWADRHGPGATNRDREVMEFTFNTARADALEEAALVADDGALNAGDTSEMGMAQAVATAIRALALTPEEKK